MDIEQQGQIGPDVAHLPVMDNDADERINEGESFAEQELVPLPTDFDMGDQADQPTTVRSADPASTAVMDGSALGALPSEPVPSAVLLQAARMKAGPPNTAVGEGNAAADGMRQDGDVTLNSVVQSLKDKGTRPAETTSSSPLSSIPDLPTFLLDSPPSQPNIPLAPSPQPSPAESSTQAAQRAQEISVPIPKKAKPAKAPKVAKPRQAKPRERKKKDEADYSPQRKQEVVDEEMIDQLASGEDEPEEVEIEKQAGKGVKRKASDKPIRYKVKAARPRNLTDNDIKELVKGKTKEVQLVTCQRSRYAGRGKCTQCVAKIGGDSCRFKDFRIFPIDPKTGEIIGPGYFESTGMTETPTPLPREFNVPFKEEYIARTESTVTPILLPLITRELRHVVNTKAIQRGVDAAKNRSVCDFCSTTIFAGYFFCRICGRDYCLSCERFVSDDADTMLESPWYLVPQHRERVSKCTSAGRAPSKGKDPSLPMTANEKRAAKMHFRPDLQAVSRFTEEELRTHWLALADFAVNGESGQVDWQQLFGFSDDDGAKLVEEIERYRTEHPPRSTNSKPRIPLSDIQAMYTSLTHPTALPPTDPAGLAANSHRFMKVDVDDLDNDSFDQIWSRGEPIVVDGVGKRLRMEWTPDEMIANFGDEVCGITECQRNFTWESTVRHFFEAFKNTENRPKGIWKLKDWPATADFQLTHPGLYNDFCDAMPVPDYTRREGAMNLYAHFPPGPTRPDIGPKMYNAFAAKEDVGGHGSTRMHMDVADAINVMLHASDRPRPRPEQPKVDAEDGAPIPEAESAGPQNGEAGPVIRDVPSMPTSVRPESTVVSEPHDGPFPTVPGPTDPPSTAQRDTTMGNDKSGHAPTQAPTSLSAILPDSEETSSAPGEPGCAVWDIFRAEDAQKIRTFLTEKFKGEQYKFTDPIHSQLFYLDAGLRKELWETMGVVSFRLYQYPGQAVFIPAGCAHQVCNLADCIKIALDFVSPHNVPRCQRLMQDFREENFVKAWKEDVLQLYTILWFAWLSCRETRDWRKKEAEVKETERAATLNDLENGPSGGFGRVMTSSMRDDPHQRNGSRPTTPPASPKPTPSNPATSLVERLLSAALSAPDPAPPPDARPPSTKTGPKWGVPARTSSAPVKSAVMKAKEETPLPAVVPGKPLKMSDHFKNGTVPIEYVPDLIAHQLGAGAEEDREQD